MEFALAVEPERLVEPRQVLRSAREERIVHAVKAQHPAVAAAHRPAHAEEADIVGWGIVIGVVVVKADFDVGLIRAHSRSRQCLLPGVEHIIDEGAVELLSDRSGDHGRQQPVDRGGFGRIHLVDRQPVDDGKAHPAGENVAHPGHRRPAGRHREIIRHKDDRRQRIGAQLVDGAADLVNRRDVERNPPILGANIGPHPGARASDRPGGNGS